MKTKGFLIGALARENLKALNHLLIQRSQFLNFPRGRDDFDA